MTRIKQFLALSLALLLLLPALANLTPAQAASEQKDYNGFTYNVVTDDGSHQYVVLRKYEGTETDLTIPEEIEGIPVETIYFDVLVTNTSTKSVTISKTVKNVWSYAFHNWTALESIYVDSENEKFESRDGVFYGKGSDGICFYPEGKKDSNLTMYGRYGTGPFDFWNPYLEEIIVGYTGGDPLPTAPEDFNLPNLKRFVTQEGDTARYTIDGILYADLSGSDKTLIRYPAGKYTGGVLQVPEGTKAFYPFAFSRMNNLTAIAIPASVSYIPFTAFNWSENLRDIYFGGSEEAWNELEFAKYGGEILNQITVHFNTTEPSEKTEKQTKDGFTYSLEIDSDPQVGRSAVIWAYDGNERDLVIPEELDGFPVRRIIMYQSRTNTATVTVTLPKTVVDFKNYSFHGWTSLESIYVDTDNEKFESRNGVLCSKGTGGMVFYPEGKKDTSLTMDGRYGPWQFDFWNPYLEEIIIGYTGGDPLPTAPEWFNLPNLKRFVTQEGDTARYTIDGILYDDFTDGPCLIRYPAGKYTGGVLQVPEGTVSFYPFAFSKMQNLTAVSIPASVRWVNSAFYDDEKLTDIYYGGTEEAWEKTEFSMCNEEETSRVIVHFNRTTPISDGWYQEDGKWFYYENGSHITGWKRLPDSHWYYFDETGVLQHGWLRDNGNWYYLNASGFMVTGWQKMPDGHWYYFNGSGILQHGWLRDGGNWYYLNASGFKVTGWQKLPDGNWYYFNGSGVLQHNWVRYSGNWYYLNASGFMVTGWQRLPDGNWYYFDGSGVMQTGWLNRGGNWYYLNSSGVMQTGWQYIGGSWYYFYPGGNMASSTTLMLGGTRYTFDASGRWVA